MKSYGGLWKEITSYKNLVFAYLDAARHKRYTASVLEFAVNWAGNLNAIQKKLLNLT